MSLLWVNAAHGLNGAPWGGAARRLGTDPHAVGIPGPDGAAFLLDFVTSVVAEGKVRVKRNRKEQTPPAPVATSTASASVVLKEHDDQPYPDSPRP